MPETHDLIPPNRTYAATDANPVEPRLGLALFQGFAMQQTPCMPLYKGAAEN